MQKQRSVPLSKRLTGQQIALIAVASNVLVWAGVLHYLMT